MTSDDLLRELRGRRALREALPSIVRLRDLGYVVLVFEPGELGEADPSRVEEVLVDLGWEVIADLQ